MYEVRSVYSHDSIFCSKPHGAIAIFQHAINVAESAFFFDVERPESAVNEFANAPFRSNPDNIIRIYIYGPYFIVT